MADLLSSLILPNNSSQESFFSSKSQHPSTPQNRPTPPPPPASPPPSSSKAHMVDFQAAGLAIYDAETYVNDPKSQALLAANAKNTPTNPGKSHDGAPPSNLVPVGAPKTNHHVTTLYMLCQKRGIVPEFEIDGSQSGFGGWLKIGNETISRDERWSTKKDAKEGLAERGVEVVRGMQEREGAPAAGVQNWVGQLQAFHDGSIDDISGPLYMEYAIGSGFACTCTIPSYPDAFGSTSEIFPSKKAARVNAARAALNYLIDQGLVNPNGSVKSRKKTKLGTAVRVQGQQLEVKGDATYAQKVNDLCPILGINAPTYRLSASSTSAPNILSGAAFFTGNPRYPDKYGEVRNIFGKKAAKEECARGVWEMLKQVAAKRGVNVEIENEMDEGI